MGFDYFSYVILPLLIFFARVLDVSIGTVRLIFISKGFKKLSAGLGFIEVLIWLIAVKQILNGVNSPILYIAYAGGFAAGTYIGMIIENKVSIGRVLIRIMIEKDANKLIEELKDKKYPMTVSGARGERGEVTSILSVIKRKDVNKMTEIIKQFNPKAFYCIEEVKYVNELRELKQLSSRPRIRNFLRKAK